MFKKKHIKLIFIEIVLTIFINFERGIKMGVSFSIMCFSCLGGARLNLKKKVIF